MKSIIKIILCVILLSFEAGAQLTDGPGYLEKLIKEFVNKLEKSDISGNGLPLPDWSATMNSSIYGTSAFGTVNFHSGFVNSIGKAMFEKLKIVITVTDDYVEISTSFYFEDIRLFFDMEIGLVDYSDLGSALILVPKIAYTVSFLHHYKTNIKTLQFLNPEITVNTMEAKLYPYNRYTQLINKQLTSTTFYTPLRDSIKTGWEDSLQEKLDAVVATASNPEICYFCKQLEI